MKKQFVLAAVVLATVFTFVSCGKKTEAEPAAETTETSVDTAAVEPVATEAPAADTAATPATETAAPAEAAPATEAPAH